MFGLSLFSGVLLCYHVIGVVGDCQLEDLYATCRLRSNPTNTENKRIKGDIYLSQTVNSNCEYNDLSIEVNIKNCHVATAVNKTSEHGFHVHTYGDLTDGCSSMGSHYNPDGSDHGAPENNKRKRHVGDFGNIVIKKGRVRNLKFTDKLAQLVGRKSIYGRGMILHAGTDDLGLGGDAGSLATGNAGARLACCVIARAPARD